MASAAQGVGVGGSNDNNSDLSCVYRAVDQGASAEQVRAILEGGPRTRRAKQQWLQGVLEHKGGPNNDETPLQAAHHRRRDGPIVGALLEHGADARELSPFTNASALAICIAYGQTNSLRVLLRSGRHSADEQVAYWAGAFVEGTSLLGYSCRPVHLCVMPPRLFPGDLPPPQLECLDVLVREFGADVNKPDEPIHSTPLHWVRWIARSDERRAFDALMALGADVNARDGSGTSFIFQVRNPEVLQQLLAQGASPNVIAPSGNTPLIRACADEREAIVSALLPLTSTETRRSVLGECSAIDYLLGRRSGPTLAPWKIPVIEELLSSRVPLHPTQAARALPFAARLAERRASEAAARQHDPPPWQVHEAMVGLAFDVLEVREVDEAVRVRERRAQELEEELNARGIGVEEDE